MQVAVVFSFAFFFYFQLWVRVEYVFILRFGYSVLIFDMVETGVMFVVLCFLIMLIFAFNYFRFDV